ncbi:helix-turn-helix domain-containing protein [Leuconostoc carnosum]|uniref:helix-turn-helix domain-containing protein n=1 Tax=Leuconostoc carnosum TaxID=1252 RepID=UPI0015598E23|nr:helix-turn-helix transcriptional regulator [Leuconostoc carnosum]
MNRLKKLRKAKGLTQQQLADEFKTTRQNISLYEKEKHDPRLKTLIKFTDYFDVSVDYLIGKEPMKIEQQIDPPEDEIWGYTLYGEEILVGETDIRETIDGEYMKPDEFERYAYDTSRYGGAQK